MNKLRLSVTLLVCIFSANIAFADCQKTLMGSDCEANNNGVSSHMRGNAVENAKASKEIKATQQKAKKEAKAIAEAKK